MRFVFLILLASLSGCLESTFELAPESRLPRWFVVPEGKSRDQVRVTMDYYTKILGGREAIFHLYENGNQSEVESAIGIQFGSHPLELEREPSALPERYPSYEIITVDGVTDIIEHRKMEPVFYMVDDPVVWKKLGIERNGYLGSE
jgi:hypothetical protein